jgi:excisionase family DNA binding protein
MSRILHDEQLSDKLDALFDVGRDFAQAWLSRWLASRDDQAEASGRIERETAPAPILSDKRELSVKELAARWGVSERSIYQWRLTGGLPFKKRGRLLRFDPIKVDQWEKGRQELFTRARFRVVK